MEVDLAYFQRRAALERDAATSAPHPAARAAHRELARLYDERIAELEEPRPRIAMHLVSAA